MQRRLSPCLNCRTNIQYRFSGPAHPMTTSAITIAANFRLERFSSIAETSPAVMLNDLVKA